jgi:hypothetical protein
MQRNYNVLDRIERRRRREERKLDKRERREARRAEARTQTHNDTEEERSNG